MKRNIAILLIVMLAGVAARAQERMVPEEVWKCAEVTGGNYHGWAFHKDWEVDVMVENQDGRFTPTDEDIAKAEGLIQSRLAYVNRFHENQEGQCPIIDEHIRKYERQYVGFTDVHGYRVMWVNFVWDDNAKLSLANDILLTEGGCGHYWHIQCNLDTEKVYGLEVNGGGDVKYVPRKRKAGPRISKSRHAIKPVRVRKTGIIHTEQEKQF